MTFNRKLFNALHPPAPRMYRVTITEQAEYELVIEAKSNAEAREKGEKLFLDSIAFTAGTSVITDRDVSARIVRDKP